MYTDAPGTYLPFVLANPIYAAIFYVFAVETKGVNCESILLPPAHEYQS
jgi:hypothetical protein